MSGPPQADGDEAGRRSGTSFDPIAGGMRAVADIQAEGLRAAGELLERVLRTEPDAPAARPRASAGAASALLDAWIELLRRTVDVLAPGPDGAAVTVAVDAAGVGPQVRLNGASAEVWLHNATPRAVGPLALHCGPLTGPEGAPLEGAGVRFDPAEIDVLPGRSSRGVVVSLDAAAPPPPGTYRGTIQARGAPRLWLPIEVVVEPC